MTRRSYCWCECPERLKIFIMWCNKYGLLTQRIDSFARPGWTTALYMPDMIYRIFSDRGVTPEIMQAARREDIEAEISNHLKGEDGTRRVEHN